MSWSFSGSVDPSGEDWTQTIWDIEEAPPSTNEAQKRAVTWAKEAVIDAIDMKVVGSIDKKFNFSANGHANPNNEPQEGFVNDMIAVYIYQKKEE